MNSTSTVRRPASWKKSRLVQHVMAAKAGHGLKAESPRRRRLVPLLEQPFPYEAAVMPVTPRERRVPRWSPQMSFLDARPARASPWRDDRQLGPCSFYRSRMGTYRRAHVKVKLGYSRDFLSDRDRLISSLSARMSSSGPPTISVGHWHAEAEDFERVCRHHRFIT